MHDEENFYSKNQFVLLLHHFSREIQQFLNDLARNQISIYLLFFYKYKKKEINT